MKLNIKKFVPEARVPEKAHVSDYCYDCWAVSEEEIAPNTWKYGLGFGLQFDPEVMNYIKDYDRSISIDVRPRSSIWKTGMTLANSTGTIDSGYTNQIFVIFYHVMPDMPRYKVGDKIAQIKIGITDIIEFNEVKEFYDTDRGLGGFGSSGKN